MHVEMIAINTGQMQLMDNCHAVFSLERTGIIKDIAKVYRLLQYLYIMSFVKKKMKDLPW